MAYGYALIFFRRLVSGRLYTRNTTPTPASSPSSTASDDEEYEDDELPPPSEPESLGTGAVRHRTRHNDQGPTGDRFMCQLTPGQGDVIAHGRSISEQVDL